MKTTIVVLVASLCIFALADRARAITLARAGRAEASIVVPVGSTSAEAAELQKYVEKVSGAKLEIVAEDKLATVKSEGRVFVGTCLAAKRVVDLKKLQPEGFVIKTDGNDIFIVGRDATDAGTPVAGTFYGVCEFLERYLGVRWLMPGPLGEVTPKQATIEIASADIRQEPPSCSARGNSFATARRSRQWPILVGASADWRPGEDFNRPCLCRLVGQVSRAIPGNIRDAAKRDAYQCQ